MKLLLALSTLSAITSANNLVKRQADENATSTSDFADFSTATMSGIPLSVEQILLTAIPASLISLAQANPASASALLASEIEHSATPAWYSALPTDIRSYLVVPATAISTVAPTTLAHPSNVTLAPGPVITSHTSVYNTTSVILPVFTTYANGSTVTNGTVIANNGTLVGGGGNGTTAGVGYNATTSGVSSRSLVPVVTTSGTGVSASSTAATPVSSSASLTATGGAAGVPTGVVGAGVVGVIGLLGMLVL